MDDSEIPAVNLDVNFWLCRNRYSANWSAQLIDVEGFALFNCGEVSSQISPCDGSGDISPAESSNALNLF